MKNKILAETKILPADNKILRAVGCHKTRPTLL